MHLDAEVLFSGSEWQRPRGGSQYADHIVTESSGGMPSIRGVWYRNAFGHNG